MRFSEKWLREWVNPPISTQELADQLTMAGLEVDAIEPVAAAFDGVVVGEVLELAPHPDADKLRVCQVAVGEAEPLQIVCGAPNVHVGMKAPTALVGARLPGGLKIKKAKLRGVASTGMLCSARELGLSEDAAGLMALPQDAPVGEAVRDYLQLDDVAIELGLTPNRGDCLSILGIAREAAVLNRLRLDEPAPEPVPALNKAERPVTLEAAADCPRYVGRVIEGIDADAATPMWLQERLRRCGLRSLNPVVDVTNYVMLELGQPMHAFDLDRVQGGIVVRHAREGESIELLDGQTLALEAGSLLIADERTPLALAGIMGGAGSAVSGTTRSIFLESAYFEPSAIAGRARGYGLHTDSSHRFERGVDPDLQRRAIERATRLILEIVGGTPGPVIDRAAEQDTLRSPIVLRQARIPRVLGMEIEADEVEDVLGRLGMQLQAVEGGWQVRPPAFRFDIEREEDLIEELARIHGYQALPVTHPVASLEMGARPEGWLSNRRLRGLLVDRGYHEAVTYSFVSPELQALVAPGETALPLANPISADLSVMRTSLWAGLLAAVVHNANRQQGRVRLFEQGLSYVPQGNDLNQIPRLAGAAYGPVYPEQWGAPARRVDFFDVKADVEALLGLSGRGSDFSFKAESHPALHPGQSARIWRGDQPLGWLGVLHPAAEQRLGLAQPVVLFELDLGVFADGRVPKFEPLSRFPAIRRDLAVIVDESVTAQALRDCVSEAVPALLTHFELFDVYRGKGIDSGRKSLALGLTFQDLSRTLTDADVDDAMERVITALQTQLRAILRE